MKLMMMSGRRSASELRGPLKLSRANEARALCPSTSTSSAARRVRTRCTEQLLLKGLGTVSERGDG